MPSEKSKKKDISKIKDPAKLFKLGYDAAEDGELDYAIECYQKVVTLHPDHYDAWNNLGDLYRMKGEFDDAIKHSQKVLELQPEYHLAWRNLGDTFFAQEEFDEAIKHYQKVVELQPDDHHAWFYLGNAYQRNFEFDAAIKHYEKALELHPDFHDAWRNLGRTYIGKTQMSLGELPSENAQKAIACFEKVIELSPNDHDVWYDLGLSYHLARDFDAAISCYQKESNIRPGDFRVWNNMACIYVDKGEKQIAIDYFKKTIKLKPDDYTAYGNIGLLYDLMGQPDLAKPYIEKFLELNKHDFKNFCVMAYDYYMLMGDFKKAREYYRRALAIKPGFEFALNNLALIEEADKLSDEIESTKEELSSVDNNLKVITGKEASGESIDALELQTKTELLDMITELQQKNTVLTDELTMKEKQIQFFNEHRDMFVCFDEIDPYVSSQTIQIKDIIKLTRMIDNLDVDFYEVTYENILVNDALKDELLEAIGKIQIPHLKNDIKELFKDAVLEPDAAALKDWVEFAVENINTYEIFSVVKLILTGVQKRATKI